MRYYARFSGFRNITGEFAPKVRIGPFVIMGATALGYAGVKSILGLKAGADEGFFDWSGPTLKDMDVGSAKLDLPAMYYRDDSFTGVFGAAGDRVSDLLPSQELRPVTLPDARAAINHDVKTPRQMKNTFCG